MLIQANNWFLPQKRTANINEFTVIKFFSTHLRSFKNIAPHPTPHPHPQVGSPHCGGVTGHVAVAIFTEWENNFCWTMMGLSLPCIGFQFGAWIIYTVIAKELNEISRKEWDHQNRTGRCMMQDKFQGFRHQDFVNALYQTCLKLIKPQPVCKMRFTIVEKEFVRVSGPGHYRMGISHLY